MNDQQAFEQVTVALHAFGQVAARSVVPLMQAVVAACERLDTLMWKAYEQAGQPYGSSAAAMLRWHKEQLQRFKRLE